MATPTSKEIREISLVEITAEHDLQSREGINWEQVENYAQDMRNGDEFPEIVVFYDSLEGNFYLADGFHRYEASKKAEKSSIKAEVKDGTRRDAMLFSSGANKKHGLYRTNADKRRSVWVALKAIGQDETWSDRRIADHCGVDHKTVAVVRAEMPTGEIPQLKIGKDGKKRREEWDYRWQSSSDDPTWECPSCKYVNPIMMMHGVNRDGVQVGKCSKCRKVIPLTKFKVIKEGAGKIWPEGSATTADEDSGAGLVPVADYVGQMKLGLFYLIVGDREGHTFDSGGKVVPIGFVNEAAATTWRDSHIEVFNAPGLGGSWIESGRKFSKEWEFHHPSTEATTGPEVAQGVEFIPLENVAFVEHMQDESYFIIVGEHDDWFHQQIVPTPFENQIKAGGWRDRQFEIWEVSKNSRIVLGKRFKAEHQAMLKLTENQAERDAAFEAIVGPDEPEAAPVIAMDEPKVEFGITADAHMQDKLSPIVYRNYLAIKEASPEAAEILAGMALDEYPKTITKAVQACVHLFVDMNKAYGNDSENKKAGVKADAAQ